jgi:pullulanase
MLFLQCQIIMIAQYNEYLIYKNNDLGVTYLKTQTSFKVWSPPASGITLRIYPDGYLSKPLEVHQMTKGENGVWHFTLKGDYQGKYYTYQTQIDGTWKNEVPDIYAKAVGVNGKRGMIVDFDKTSPEGWNNDISPNYGHMKDAILYELHIRDATIFTNSINKGKFLGLTDLELKNMGGQTAGLAHIKELGVTHVHLLPIYDYFTVDERIPNPTDYNWGYDPLNYNVPEGGYSTDPYNGMVRIKEFKKMVKTFHENGLNVVMDVVYNHTMFLEESNFNQLVPGYYYRQNTDGSFSNASACGNETASERYMFRKFIIESLVHWVKEYHIDGFRFDLMGIHDIETMNEIAKTLRAIKPSILLYGEGWTAADSPLPEEKRAIKKYAYKLDDIAVFGDDMRDGVKGSVFHHKDTGFVSGKKEEEESIKFGLIGAGKHTDIEYSKVNYSKLPYTSSPYQMISYTECHDNHTLWDRLLMSMPLSTETERIKMQMLSLGIVLTSQGIPFIHAGQEFCRTKNGEENSYKSPDSVNGIDWERKSQYKEVYEFTKSLIHLRKTHPAFRLGSQELVQEHVSFPYVKDGIIVMRINNAPDDDWKDIYVIFNAQKSPFNPFGIVPNSYQLKIASAPLIKNNGERGLIDAQTFAIMVVE